MDEDDIISPTCGYCEIEFTSEFKESILDSIDDYYDEWIEWNESLNICCEQNFEDCKCIKPLTTDMFYTIPPEDIMSLYDLNHNVTCSMCVYSATLNCPSLRHILSSIALNGKNELGPISPCDFYEEEGNETEVEIIDTTNNVNDNDEDDHLFLYNLMGF